MSIKELIEFKKIEFNAIDQVAVNALTTIYEILEGEQKVWQVRKRTKTLDAINDSLCLVNKLLRVMSSQHPDERLRMLAFHLKDRTLSDVMGAIRTAKSDLLAHKVLAEQRRNTVRNLFGVFISEMQARESSKKMLEQFKTFVMDETSSLELVAKQLNSFDTATVPDDDAI